MIPKTLHKQLTNDYNSTVQGKLKFAEEYYNLKRKPQKRDLSSIALHRHPKSDLKLLYDDDVRQVLRQQSVEAGSNELTVIDGSQPYRPFIHKPSSTILLAPIVQNEQKNQLHLRDIIGQAQKVGPKNTKKGQSALKINDQEKELEKVKFFNRQDTETKQSTSMVERMMNFKMVNQMKDRVKEKLQGLIKNTDNIKLMDEEQAAKLYQIINKKARRQDTQPDFRNAFSQLDKQSPSMFDLSQFSYSEKKLDKSTFSTLEKLQPRSFTEKQNVQKQFFWELQPKERIEVIRILNNMKHDYKNLIDRDRLTKGINTEFPGDEDMVLKMNEWMLLEWARAMNQLALKNSNPKTIANVAELIRYFRMMSELQFEKLVQDLIHQTENGNQLIGSMVAIKDLHQFIKSQGLALEEVDLGNYINYLTNEQQKGKVKREDYLQKFELGAKSLNNDYQTYVKQEVESMKTIANEIIQRYDYNTVNKAIWLPVSVDKYAENPTYTFLTMCDKDRALALPILTRVVNKQLCLRGYRLDISVIRALSKSFEFQPDAINKFLLKNCGIHDAELQILFKEMMNLTSVGSIILEQSDIGLKSVQLLKEVFQRDRPINLHTLRLTNCKMSQATVNTLIQQFTTESNLRVLGLININMPDNSLKDIAVWLQNNNKLTQLDLSWNKQKPFRYLPLIEALAKNRSLMTVNLSWNGIFQDEVQVTEPDYGDSEWYLKEKLTDHNEKVTECICELVKKNKMLMHINLESINMPQTSMGRLAKSMRRAKAMNSIHFSHNVGINEPTKRVFETLLKTRRFKTLIHFKPSQVVKKFQNNNQVLQDQLERQTENIGEQPLAKETIKLKQIMDRKRMYQLQEPATQNTGIMILQRLIGHKFDMPRSGQWRICTNIHEECWVCGLSQYSLLFWSQQVEDEARKCYTSEVHREIINEFLKATETQLDSNDPVVFGSWSNWQAIPMIPIFDFCEILEPIFTNDYVIKSLHDEGLVRPSNTNLEEFSNSDLKIFKEQMAKLKIQYCRDWQTKIQKFLRWRKPHIQDGWIEGVNEDPLDKLWVLPRLLPVGKNEYIIRRKDEAGVYQYSVHTTMVDVRTEEIPFFVKQSRILKEELKFDKMNSVFAPWKEDNKTILDQAYQFDFESWKLRNQIKNKEQDYKDLCSFIKSVGEILKDIYVELQAQALSFPFISQSEALNFCYTTKMFDHDFKSEQAIVNFAGSCQIILGSIYGKKGLVRCEFIEFLVRCCRNKYQDNGICATLTDSFRKLFDEHIASYIKMCRPWQQFRQKELWQQNIHDLIFTNAEGIKKLHEIFVSPLEPKMTFNSCIRLLTKMTDLKLTHHHAKYCVIFAKMTSRNEVYEFEKYLKLELVEFYEIIGRIATVKFVGTDFDRESLQTKMECVLDFLFPLVGVKRKEVPVHDEPESESDDDY